MLAQPAVAFSVIERDIVLEKLRKLYEQTLGLEPAQSVEPAQQEESAPEIVEIAPIAVAVAEEPTVEEPIEESVIELIEEIIDQVEELPETEEDEEIEEEVEEPTEELIVEEEPVVEEEFVIEEEPVVEEPVAPKAKIDHKRVLSLYDDDDETPIIEAPAEDEPAVEELVEEEPIEEPIEEEIVFEMDMTLDEEEIAPAEEVVVEIEEEQVEVELAVEEPAEEPTVEEPAAPAVEEIRTVVLADVLGGEQTTLAEAMSAAQTPDVASVAAAATTSLMKSISINDKVLLMRDLFGGDSRMYEQAMEVLDSYESLDEAMLFIYDNFEWNPNSEGAKLLMELLSRKLL